MHGRGRSAVGEWVWSSELGPQKSAWGRLGELTKMLRTPILAALLVRSPRGPREASSEDADDRFSFVFHRKQKYMGVF